MKKISFSERYGLHQAVLSGRKTMTRRIAKSDEPLYKEGEVVAVAQRYSDIYPIDTVEAQNLQNRAGWRNKMFVNSALMLHHIKITHVHREPLWEITGSECFKEGLCKWVNEDGLTVYDLSKGFEMYERDNKPFHPVDAFGTLFNKLTGKDAWYDNPEVWVYEFKLVD